MFHIGPMPIFTFKAIISADSDKCPIISCIPNLKFINSHILYIFVFNKLQQKPGGGGASILTPEQILSENVYSLTKTHLCLPTRY